jgi:hypothetical protein
LVAKKLQLILPIRPLNLALAKILNLAIIVVLEKVGFGRLEIMQRA